MCSGFVVLFLLLLLGCPLWFFGFLLCLPLPLMLFFLHRMITLLIFFLLSIVLCCWLGGHVRDLSRSPPWVLVRVSNFAPFHPWPLGLLIYCFYPIMLFLLIVRLSSFHFLVLCIGLGPGVSFFSLIWTVLWLIWPGRFLMVFFIRPRGLPPLVMISPPLVFVPIP